MQCSPPTITTPRWPWAGRAREASVFPRISGHRLRRYTDRSAAHAGTRNRHSAHRGNRSTSRSAPAGAYRKTGCIDRLRGTRRFDFRGFRVPSRDVLPIELHLGATVQNHPRSLARGAGHLGAGRTAVALPRFFPVAPTTPQTWSGGQIFMLGSCGALGTRITTGPSH